MIIKKPKTQKQTQQGSLPSNNSQAGRLKKSGRKFSRPDRCRLISHCCARTCSCLRAPYTPALFRRSTTRQSRRPCTFCHHQSQLLVVTSAAAEQLHLLRSEVSSAPYLLGPVPHQAMSYNMCPTEMHSY